jgi:hypothetical protein
MGCVIAFFSRKCKFCGKETHEYHKCCADVRNCENYCKGCKHYHNIHGKCGYNTGKTSIMVNEKEIDTRKIVIMGKKIQVKKSIAKRDIISYTDRISYLQVPVYSTRTVQRSETYYENVQSYGTESVYGYVNGRHCQTGTQRLSPMRVARTRTRNVEESYLSGHKTVENIRKEPVYGPEYYVDTYVWENEKIAELSGKRAMFHGKVKYHNLNCDCDCKIIINPQRSHEYRVCSPNFQDQFDYDYSVRDK